MTKSKRTRAAASPSPSQESPRPTRAAAAAAHPAKRAKTERGQSSTAAAAAAAAAAGEVEPAPAAAIAAAAAAAAEGGPRRVAAASRVAAAPPSLAAQLASAELLALLKSDKPLNEKVLQVEKAVDAEWMRHCDDELRLLVWDFSDVLAPGSGTLLTAMLRMLDAIPAEDDSKESSLLWRIMDDDSMPMVAMLLQESAYDVRLLDDGWSALHLLCETVHPHGGNWCAGMVKTLVSRGAAINVCNPNGFLPLLRWATTEDDDSAFSVLFLLELLAAINAADKDGDTLAHVYADAQRSKSEFQQLLSSRFFSQADLTLRNKDGHTPLQLAQQRLAHLRAEDNADNDAIQQQYVVVLMLAQLTPAASVAEAAQTAVAPADSAGATANGPLGGPVEAQQMQPAALPAAAAANVEVKTEPGTTSAGLP